MSMPELYYLRVLINYRDNTDREHDIATNASLQDLEGLAQDTIRANPDATSFVFTVVRA
jgi:hypothetical protein